MGSGGVRWFVVVVVVSGMFARSCYSQCRYAAIFNFGDSTSDTGGYWAAFPPEPPSPNGMTYFRRPSGRASDGRLVIDFLAEAMALPMLTPYLDSVDSNFRFGVNFATIGSTILSRNSSESLTGTGISPFSLEVQLNQMKRFKSKIDFMFSNVVSGPYNLPEPNVFEKSLYAISIGQDEFTFNLATLGMRGVERNLHRMVAKIAKTIKEIYGLGGRSFLVQNTAPVGCFPAFLAQPDPPRFHKDMFGCIRSYNDIVMAYNNKLKRAVHDIRRRLVNSTVIYADTYTVLLDLFHHPGSNGLEYGTRACCGYGGGAHNFDASVFCRSSKVIGGKNLTATACSDPRKYVSWDGVHATEFANMVVAHQILEGTHSDPPFRMYCA